MRIGPLALRGRILVFDERTPTPDQDSGSASAFAFMRVLARAGFNVTFVAAAWGEDPRYIRMLNRAGIKTAVEFDGHRLDAALDTYGPNTDVMLLYRASLATHLIDHARRAAPKARIVFHPVDLHFLRMRRAAELTGDRAQGEQAEAMRVRELDLIARADAAIVVSSHEAELLADLVPGALVHHVPILRPTPTPSGLPGWRHVRRLLGARYRGPQGRRDILFIGGFDHAPNVDAVLWFVREVWPRVLARGFGDTFIIAGSAMPQAITALASERIEIRGHVPELAPLFGACRMSIAPLRYGGGIKGKIVSSLSYGVPVVATSIAAEGMGLRHGDDILIADDPDDIAERIAALYGDADLWTRLAANGYAAFTEKFSEAAGAAKIVRVFDGLLPGTPVNGLARRNPLRPAKS